MWRAIRDDGEEVDLEALRHLDVLEEGADVLGLLAALGDGGDVHTGPRQLKLRQFFQISGVVGGRGGCRREQEGRGHGDDVANAHGSLRAETLSSPVGALVRLLLFGRILPQNAPFRP